MGAARGGSESRFVTNEQQSPRIQQLLPEGTVHIYYEASAAIITLILVGKYLEAVAKGRTSEAIKKLLSLQAKTARVVREGAGCPNARPPTGSRDHLGTARG